MIGWNWHDGRHAYRRYAPQHWLHRGGVSLATNIGGVNASTGRFPGPLAAAMHVADTVLNSSNPDAAR
ncbi:hypothetical protein BRPE64_ACDS09300 [Caballeronia insecticola]|uniref:Uncharacterized protein n=1 Tax=Caballeronia insecticola TaxID=758793 RepID=R4WG53_9BURK|nr:hypothetical protein BRPE64_ACDS09300 [Caballeronia insecticola]